MFLIEKAGQEFDCFFLQTCRDLKDRQQLLAYRSKVDKGSAEEEKIDVILSSSVNYPPVSLGEHSQSSIKCMLPRPRWMHSAEPLGYKTHLWVEGTKY